VTKLMAKVLGKSVEVRFRTEEEIEAQEGANRIIASQVAVREMST
jgi:hypothetical protein